MKNRPNESISSSDDSEAENPPVSKSSTTVNNFHSKEFISDSSSDSERSSSQNNAQQKVKSTVSKKIGGNALKEFAATISGVVRHESRVVIDEDHEISFLEVPKFLDIEQFLGKLINFDKKTKIKINKVKYVIEPTNASTKPLTLLTKKLQVIHPLTTLQLREHVKEKNNIIEIQAEKFKPSLPENLKTRHPLFGAEYKNKIVLSEEIEQKLDNTIEHFVKKMKKKRKHRDKKNEIEESTSIKQEKTCENGEAIFTLLEKHSPGKKKKKKANKDVEYTTDQEDDTKIKKNNIINSTVIPDLQLPSFEFDVSGIGHEPAKSKKKKKEKSFDESESASERESGSRKRKLSCLSSQSESEGVKKEKKRGSGDSSTKKKQNRKVKKEKTETDSLITDLLSMVKSEIGDNEKIKKNKSDHHYSF